MLFKQSNMSTVLLTSARCLCRTFFCSQEVDQLGAGMLYNNVQAPVGVFRV